jgi:hypothetical protein
MALLVVLGVAVGFLAATPVLYVLYRAARGDRPSIAAGLGSILASFFGIQLVILAVYLAEPTAILPFGGAASFSFLIVVTVAGLVTWFKAPRG